MKRSGSVCGEVKRVMRACGCGWARGGIVRCTAHTAPLAHSRELTRSIKKILTYLSPSLSGGACSCSASEK